MSDFSIISHDYALNADFASRFNEAVLNLKRQYLLKKPETEGQASETKGLRVRLAQMLESLRSVLEENTQPCTGEQVPVPADVVERLRKRFRGELPELLSQLSSIVRTIESNARMQEADFEALDNVCEAADATASAAFRRLRRI